MTAMDGEVPERASRAQAARRKAQEADRRYADTVEEIRQHFGVLLDLRDRRIEALEKELGRLAAVPEVESGAEAQERLDVKVMVVTDSAVLRTALVAVLQRRLHAFGTHSGQQAVETLAEGPDLVLLGPDLSGAEVVGVVRRIREVAKALPILVMGRPGDEDLMAALQGFGVVRVSHGKPPLLTRTVAEVEAFCRLKLGQG